MIIKKQADNIVEAAYTVTGELLKENIPLKPVMIKPNIVEPSPPPVTTNVKVIEGTIKALKESGIKDIFIAEGSGTGDTIENFNKLGYSKLGVKLIDFNKEKIITLTVKKYKVWREIIVPEILIDKFIISVPVLKEHSMCGATISLKNMVGILPEKYYSGYWTYKKSRIHKYDTHGCIADIISVIKPDWAIVDATIGMKGSHLSGTPIYPPINLVYASSDPLEADIFGCELLGRDWRNIKYLSMIAEDKKGG
jgi:uncharacterized protein (DUF362 family)